MCMTRQKSTRPMRCCEHTVRMCCSWWDVWLERPRISAWQAKVRLARSALPRTSVTRARLPIHLVGVPRSVELAVGARPMVSVLQATLRLQVARSALLRANVSRVIAPLAHSKDWSGSNLQALSMGNAWRMTKTVTSVLSPPHLQLVEVVQ